ncbi:hypothetical protein CALVIDRAFT_189323 [Calocera viscosa TUFC12733]|uniref:Uncharacterized protein n=1 Tax=Calocera viscosa (strain TUFC12733) TaxID=1330018 RepID=A0A167KWC4_CALVF|nr:hypothetical protein CALVIDRAFT_189323 [Calocera viscosa TUFC12733]
MSECRGTPPARKQPSCQSRHSLGPPRFFPYCTLPSIAQDMSLFPGKPSLVQGLASDHDKEQSHLRLLSTVACSSDPRTLVKRRSPDQAMAIIYCSASQCTLAMIMICLVVRLFTIGSMSLDLILALRMILLVSYKAILGVLIHHIMARCKVTIHTILHGLCYSRD